MAESGHDTFARSQQDSRQNPAQGTTEAQAKDKGKAKVSETSLPGDENMMSVQVGARPGPSGALDHVPGLSWQLEPLSSRTDLLSHIQSTPRKIQQWPKEQAPLRLSPKQDTAEASRSASSRARPALVEADGELESGEIPQHVVSVETYMYLGWSAAKAARLFRSWRRSSSDDDDPISFFNHAMHRGLGPSQDDGLENVNFPKAYWARRLRGLGINEATLQIVLDDPGTDVLGRRLGGEAAAATSSAQPRPRRGAISWTRQVMHSRWFWLHWFKQIDFAGPHFTDNLVSDKEHWLCLSRFTASLPSEICSVQTLLFLGFDLRRAAIIYTEWKDHLDANPDPFTDAERQESLLHDALDWLECNEDDDVFVLDQDWSAVYQLVGMSRQLCQASHDPLFLALRQKLKWHSALTCLKDFLLARWRLIFRLKALPYPGPDADTVSIKNLPLSEARYGSELL